MKCLALAAVLLCASVPVRAADVALILTESEQRDLILALDAAAKGAGINIVTPVSHILEKLKTAPAVKERTEATPEENK